MERPVHHAPTVPLRKRPKRKRRFLKIVITLVVIIALCYLALFLIVVPERPDYPFFDRKDQPLVIAHRGGMSIAPENTLVAFKRGLELGADMIQFDVQLSRDGHLVVIHDETVDRTTNGEGYVSELTLSELQQLDAAYSFIDIRGHYVYRNQGISIPTVEEVFQAFPDAKMMIDVKDTPVKEDEHGLFPDVIPPEETVEVVLARKLWELIETYGMEEQVLVTSTNDEFVYQFKSLAQDQVPVAAGRQEATRFVFYHKLFLGRLYRPDADVLAIPSNYNIIDLKDQRLVDGAKRLNMPHLYREISEESVMRELLELEVDGIVTDRPDLLIRIIQEMEGFDERN